MGGFLIASFIPVEFTCILTATVWSFSGRVYALIFLVAGTFLRVDSFTIFSGIQDIVIKSVPSLAGTDPQYVTIGVMFFGNLAMTVLFKKMLRRSVLQRIPPVLFAA